MIYIGILITAVLYVLNIVGWIHVGWLAIFAPFLLSVAVVVGVLLFGALAFLLAALALTK